MPMSNNTYRLISPQACLPTDALICKESKVITFRAPFRRQLRSCPEPFPDRLLEEIRSI